MATKEAVATDRSYGRNNRFLFRAIVLALGCDVIGACRPRTGFNESGTPRSRDSTACSSLAEAPALDTAVQNREARSSDAQLARSTRGIAGGFGGTFTENGQTVVLLTHPDQRDVALEQLAKIQPTIIADSRRVVIRQARWTFSQLLDWQSYVTSRFSSRLVTSTYIDQPNNRIVVTVADGNAQRIVASQLVPLNLPCQVVAILPLGIPRLGTP